MPSPYIVLFLLLGCVSLSLQSTPNNNAKAGRLFDLLLPKSDDQCGFSCWLGNLTIHIPDMSGKEDGLTYDISNITCRGITICNLNSSLINSINDLTVTNDGAGPSYGNPPQAANGIILKAAGVGIDCSAHWEGGALGITEQGNLGATVHDSEVDIKLVLMKNKTTGLAQNASLTSCSTSFQFYPLNFTGGGILNSLLEKLSSSVITPFLVKELDSITCTELTTLVDTNLTQVLGNISYHLLPYMQPPKPFPSPIFPKNSADLTRSTILGLIDYFLNDLVGANGALGINKIMNYFTNDTGAVLVPDVAALLNNVTHLLPSNLPFNISNAFILPINSTLGTIELVIQAFNISGLNSWNQFDILEPTKATALSSRTGMDKLALSLQFLINVTTASETLQTPYSLIEVAQLATNLSSNTLGAEMAVAINSTALSPLVGNQVLDAGCLERGYYDANMTELTLNFTVDGISLVAMGGDIEAELDHVLNDVASLFIQSYVTAIPAVFNMAVTTPLRVIANVALENFGYKADNATCEGPQDVFAGNWDREATTYFGAGLGGFFIIAVLALVTLSTYYFARPVQRDEETEPLVSAERLPEKEYLPPSPSLSEASDYVSFAPVRDPPLVLDPSMYMVVRYSLLFLILVNIGLFLTSNTSNGAAVYIMLKYDYGETVMLPPLFKFGLSSTVRDMWSAQVYPLSILVAVFSGGWPYLKLGLMLLCWVLPPSILPVRVRGRLLWLVDALGKWSLVDSLVLVLFMGAFHFVIVPPVTENTPAGAISVISYVLPMIGYYTFLCGTILSLFLSHILVFLHRRIVEPAGPEPYGHETLSQRVFGHRAGSKAGAVWSCAGSFMVMVLLLVALVLTCVGQYVYSYEYHFMGAFAVMNTFLGTPNNLPFSVLTTGGSFLSASLDPNSFGVRAIQVSFFVFVVAMPIAYLLSLMVLWGAGLTYRWQRRVLTIVEIMQAWSSLEVFVVAIIASLLEIRQFAQFIIGDRCNLINKLLEKYQTALPLDGNTRCFDVEAKLLSGCWILFAGALLYTIVGSVIIRASHTALEKRKGEAVEFVNMNS
eukprot:TRINITY_DN1997_c0_g1_i2.p1 TRINITY_DN1997_c0_g1~~TRINITY_DN1997_c0_g1_i2.p1  ORF type:complete len:1061 (-),score=196.82 TRINITY_DN1997_c0_g1_i2:41-3223(-)